MLINFTVGNYRSFKERKSLSMEATAIKEHNEYVKIRGNLKLLPSAVLYGANSSGKSNLIKALSTFRRIIVSSSKLNSTDNIPVVPFLLSDETENQPTTFEIEILVEADIYRYGFKADTAKVHEEWLFSKTNGKGREKCLFVRTSEGIGITPNFPEGKDLEEKTRDNALFLSTVDSFNGEISKKIIRTVTKIVPLSGINHGYLAESTEKMCNELGKFHEVLDNFFTMLDLGFNKFQIPDDPDVIRRVKAYTYHNKYDKNGLIIDQVRFNMKQNESSGTNKIYDLSSPIITALKMGLILIIDELDSKLHPILTQRIIKLFNDSEQNMSGQLIFATHDTNLLSNKVFRRDQIWFTEKDKTEATDLYSLVEFKEPDGTKIRNDRSYEKDYINGRYGAIPYIKN
uniref:AAA family ATPase n=1 Tax=Alistipes sp. D31t1_170403_E11 TaxID=2787128 RepID=UPI001899F6E4|nr:ATP-binding protein [Alistipes sp. D31t1_170403_E11]